ncbi:NCS2 family permease [Clostridioides difficile]|uniref:NCS2 family permease n=1 Tax=Terrisporobacter glycolicus TaxID=36841 RepID=UPI000AEA4F7D
MQVAKQESNTMTKLFPILENEGVNMKKEIMAGVTTFLTMAYIIAVNPSILSEAGMPAGALVTGTCLAAAIGCFIMGIIANLPFALASGMGLNAYFAYTVVLGMGVSWEVALAAVFVEGIIFIFLSLFKVREAVVNAIPVNMKLAVSGGIGLFIAIIGFINCGLVVKSDATLITMGHFTPAVLISCVGIIIIAVLSKRNVKGSILIGIVVCSLVAWGYALSNPTAAAKLGIYLPSGVFKFESLAPIAGKLDFSYATNPANLTNFILVLCTFLFVDFFDTVGTIVGVASKANMIDEDGNVPHVGRALLADAFATTIGAGLGVSTVTTYVESSTGVIEGGRTGYTAITVGVLFLVAMFFSPIFIAIPSCATSPALIYVGYLMLSTVKDIDFSDITEGVPAFITIGAMAFTYSIGDGLTLGVLSYVVINILYNLIAPKEERKKISSVMVVLAVLFVLKLIYL